MAKLTTAAWRLGIAFAAVYLLWGSTYLAIRFAVETLPPLVMAGVRHILAGGIMYAVLRARGAPKPNLLNWRAAAIVGTMLLFGGNGGVTWAEMRGVPSGLTALLVATVPLWMVLFHKLTDRTARVGWRTAGGIAIGLFGVALLVDPSAADRIDTWGALALLAATITWAAGSIYSKKAALPKPAMLAVSMELLAGGLVLVLVGLAIGEGSRIDVATMSSKSILAFLYLVVFGSIVGFTAYIYLLNHTTPANAVTYAYVNPVVAVALGWAFAGETLSVRTAIAGAIILAAVVLITLGQRSTPAPPKATVAAVVTTTETA